MQTWYHGTSRKHIEEIRRSGLRPPGNVQPAMWLMVTDSFAQASQYAPAECGVVIEYHIPEALTDYRADGAVLWPARAHNCYGVAARAAGIKGNLPGAFIARVHSVSE